MGSEISCIYIARVEDGNPLEQFCTSNVRNEHFLTGPSGHFRGWLFGCTPPTQPLHDQTVLIVGISPVCLVNFFDANPVIIKAA
jgi:hypothetical protein